MTITEEMHSTCRAVAQVKQSGLASRRRRKICSDGAALAWFCRGAMRGAREKFETTGTTCATTAIMAAVFALILVPALGAVLCMLGGIHGHVSFATIAAGSMFFVLTAGVLGVLFQMSRQWEVEDDVKPHAG